MLLLKSGSILNMETGKFEKKDILIEDEKIIQMEENINPINEKVINCENQFLIPGLIDMHVHIKENFANFFTASGLTTVRNTAGSVIELSELMHAPADAMVPRVISADRMIDGPPGLWGDTSPYNINVSTPKQVIEEVKRQVETGADFIKVYGWLEPELMEVVVKEAEKFGKSVSSDLMYSTKVHAIDAAKMGVQWFEHASGILQSMYPTWNMNAEESIWSMIPWDNPDAEKIKEVCTILLDHKVKLCPTLVLYDQANRGKDYWSIEHETIREIEKNEGLIKQWRMILQHPAFLSKLGKQIRTIQKIAYIYFKMGGTVVAGTDTPAGIFTYPGMALHRELQLFVEAGFTNFEALQTATINAAKALNMNNIGEIKEGFLADIVILNYNPLEDIVNTTKIAQIIKGGQSYTPKQLIEKVPSAEEMKLYYVELEKKFEKHNLM